MTDSITKFISQVKKVKDRGLSFAETKIRRKVASAGGKTLLNKRGREYFVELGRKGGRKISQNHAHMVAIGRKGGQNRRGWTNDPEPSPPPASPYVTKEEAKVLRATPLVKKS